MLFYASELINRVPGGDVEEVDFGFWVPLVRTNPDGSEALVVYTPYLWVDSSPALVNGATVFGFPKQMGGMRMPEGPDAHDLRFELSCWLQPVMGKPVEKDRMIDLRPRGTVRQQRLPARPDELVVELLRALTEDPAWMKAQVLFLTRGMRQVFLKQFMSADGTLSASHRQILEADLPVHLYRDFRLLEGEWELMVRRCASHAITETLGLSQNSYSLQPLPSFTMTVSRAFYSSFIASVQPAEVIGQL